MIVERKLVVAHEWKERRAKWKRRAKMEEERTKESVRVERVK